MTRSLRGLFTFSLLPVLAFVGGCRCEKLGESDCNAKRNCDTVVATEADLEAMCRGKSIYLGCRRIKDGEPQEDTRRLLRDEEGRHWIAEPAYMPDATVLVGRALPWATCDHEVEPPKAEESESNEELDGGS